MYVMYVLSMIYEVEGLALKLLYGLHFPRLDPFGLGSIFSCSSEMLVIGIRCVDAIPIISIDIIDIWDYQGMGLGIFELL